MLPLLALLLLPLLALLHLLLLPLALLLLTWLTIFVIVVVVDFAADDLGLVSLLLRCILRWYNCMSMISSNMIASLASISSSITCISACRVLDRLRRSLNYYRTIESYDNLSICDPCGLGMLLQDQIIYDLGRHCVLCFS